MGDPIIPATPATTTDDGDTVKVIGEAQRKSILENPDVPMLWINVDAGAYRARRPIHDGATKDAAE